MYCGTSLRTGHVVSSARTRPKHALRNKKSYKPPTRISKRKTKTRVKRRARLIVVWRKEREPRNESRCTNVLRNLRFQFRWYKNYANELCFLVRGKTLFAGICTILRGYFLQIPLHAGARIRSRTHLQRESFPARCGRRAVDFTGRDSRGDTCEKGFSHERFHFPRPAVSCRHG